MGVACSSNTVLTKTSESQLEPFGFGPEIELHVAVKVVKGNFTP